LSNNFDNKLLVIAIILAFLGLTSPFIFKFAFGGNTLSYDTLSNLGDWLGGTSAPLLNLAAFIMILAAYKSQQEELELTREEMKLTRQEFKEQNATLGLQRFENTFFNLLSNNNDIVNALQFESKNNQGERFTVTGRSYFNEAYNLLFEAYENDQTRKLRKHSSILDELFGEIDEELEDTKTEYELIKYSYKYFFEEHQSYIGHYFRNLYHIIRIIDKAPIADNEKKDFVKIVVAQLSMNELLLLFYNCFVSQGKERFKPLVIKYGMLENMDRRWLLHHEHWDLFMQKSNE